MSTRDYEVALIRVSPEMEPEVGVRGAGIFDAKWYVGGPRRGSQHGFHDVEVIRPLVVIDPEASDLYIARDGDNQPCVWLAKNACGLPEPKMTEHQAGPVLWAHLVATLPTRDEPQPEPLDPGVRVRDGDGDEWVRRTDGVWVCIGGGDDTDDLSFPTLTWDGVLNSKYEVITPAPEPTPDERPFKVGDEVIVTGGGSSLRDYRCVVQYVGVHTLTLKVADGSERTSTALKRHCEHADAPC